VCSRNIHQFFGIPEARDDLSDDEVLSYGYDHKPENFVELQRQKEELLEKRRQAELEAKLKKFEEKKRRGWIW
jgi:transcription initiation factor TFIID subunit TAF12